MEALIEEIVRKLHHLPEGKILEVLDFVEFLTWNKERSISQQVESDVTSQEDREFEAIADRVADEFEIFIGQAYQWYPTMLSVVLESTRSILEYRRLHGIRI